ncbi:hypothetical protein C8R45DRAFT_1189264, partial [Mycena sanguinolenta]
NATELPNPFTPLAFLPPALASQFELSRYLYAATLGAYTWDIGLNLGNDHALLFKHKVRFPTFFQAIPLIRPRAFTLAYVLVCYVIQVGPVKNCAAAELGVGICLLLSQTATAMLFFLRVTAVWYPNKIAYVVFSILWLAVLGAGISAPLGILAAHIGPTMQCINTDVPTYVEVAVIVPLINDSAIFLAITYRIIAHTIVADSLVALIRVFFGGTGLSRLSQALLRSGQHFYLVAVAAHIPLLVAVKPLTPVDHTMLAVPVLALINAMACLIFRRIKLGLLSSDGTSKMPTIDFHSDFHPAANPRSLSLQFHHTDPTAMAFESNKTFPLDVRVQSEIDGFENAAEASQEMSKPTGLAPA